MAQDLTPTEADIAQARRMPELHAFFERRNVAELLMDLQWLSQYLVYRHHTRQIVVVDVLQRLDQRFRELLQTQPYFPDQQDEVLLDLVQATLQTEKP